MHTASTCVGVQVWKHKLGSHSKDDELVYHEEDDSFYIGIGQTRSKKYLYIAAGVDPLHTSLCNLTTLVKHPCRMGWLPR